MDYKETTRKSLGKDHAQLPNKMVEAGLYPIPTLTLSVCVP